MNRPPALFVGGAPGLDFLNSIATPVDTPVDWLDDGEGYLSWLEHAHLVPRDILRDMRARAVPGRARQGCGAGARPPGMVQSLRAAGIRAAPLTAEALAELAPLNRLLERDETFGRIVLSPAGPRRFQLEARRRWRTSTRCCSRSPRRWLISSARRTFRT